VCPQARAAAGLGASHQRRRIAGVSLRHHRTGSTTPGVPGRATTKVPYDAASPTAIMEQATRPARVFRRSPSRRSVPPGGPRGTLAARSTICY